MNCESCRWWHSNPPRKLGACQRYPPYNTIDLEAIAAGQLPPRIYPATTPGDWCGEHTPHVHAPAGARVELDKDGASETKGDSTC